ncbi:MAG TPA: class I SAM-dependent rRNA methyltransferase [Verrucomicrobiae bacterium]|nr:class I SAM-dependent rRNA methyltransferase [Verrucomicrobiae bacterium]
MPSVILKKGKDRRLQAGHCWVYAGEIEKITGERKDGAAVDIRDSKERFLGRGLLNTNSQITVRRFTTQKEELDKAFFARRIEEALEYRREDTSVGDAQAFRVVCSEGDLLPGLVVDHYGDHCVLQALTLGIDQRKAQIVDILRELFVPAAILERSDVPSRKLEGLEETKGVLFGQTDAIVRLQLAHFSIEVNLLEDQKTGFFLDQRDNYAEVARHCAGKRVLDCFSYHGGFSLAAGVADAARVEAVEISEVAVARARKNAELNGLTDKIEFLCANAFDVLKQYDSDKRQFDVIVLDPPTFTRTKQNIDGALRGYKEINLRALKMLPPGGLLATFTCSHHIDTELFKAIVVDAAADAKKTLRTVKILTQAPDHPRLPAVPETEYLRGLLLQVM